MQRPLGTRVLLLMPTNCTGASSARCTVTRKATQRAVGQPLRNWFAVTRLSTVTAFSSDPSRSHSWSNCGRVAAQRTAGGQPGTSPHCVPKLHPGWLPRRCTAAERQADLLMKVHTHTQFTLHSAQYLRQGGALRLEGVLGVKGRVGRHGVHLPLHHLRLVKRVLPESGSAECGHSMRLEPAQATAARAARHTTRGLQSCAPGHRAGRT